MLTTRGPRPRLRLSMANKVIVTIHGIHTQPGSHAWQENIKYVFSKIDPSVQVQNFKYGYVYGFFSWIWSWALDISKLLRIAKRFTPRYVKEFDAFLEQIFKDNSDAEVSILAHSLGTWITNEIIQSAKYKFKNIVLVAGVVSENIENLNYLDWIQLQKITQVVAWCSHNDLVVEDIALPPFGKLGYYGFLRSGYPGDEERPAANPYFEVENRQTSEDHSGVLEKMDLYGDELFRQLTA